MKSLFALTGIYQPPLEEGGYTAVPMLCDAVSSTLFAFVMFPGAYNDVYDIASKAKYAKTGGDIMGESSLINRPLTWCDVLYMAACEACKDKTILITRFPMDSYFNEFPILVRVSTTKETEKMKKIF